MVIQTAPTMMLERIEVRTIVASTKWIGRDLRMGCTPIASNANLTRKPEYDFRPIAVAIHHSLLLDVKINKTFPASMKSFGVDPRRGADSQDLTCKPRFSLSQMGGSPVLRTAAPLS
jgi:hypothetical protein